MIKKYYEYYEKLCKESEDPYNRLILRGLSELLDGNYQRAIDTFHETIQQTEDKGKQVSCAFLAALAYVKIGEISKAIRSLLAGLTYLNALYVIMLNSLLTALHDHVLTDQAVIAQYKKRSIKEAFEYLKTMFKERRERIKETKERIVGMVCQEIRLFQELIGYMRGLKVIANMVMSPVHSKRRGMLQHGMAHLTLLLLSLTHSIIKSVDYAHADLLKSIRSPVDFYSTGQSLFSGYEILQQVRPILEELYEAMLLNRCPFCGAIMPNNATYCGICGRKLRRE